MAVRRRFGFTMIELLIVISIIAILAAAIIPNFIGFDAEARIAATKSNLDNLRTRITLFRSKEGAYPTSLDDLVNRTYIDAGAKKPYLQRIPSELVSSKKGSSESRVQRSDDPLTSDGGWVYLTDTAEVVINVDEPLDKSWGDYAGQRPSKW
ncbi:MAG: prepilin-type N-terminal cleavage/methylation domain-containing protein [Candidatus Omnitrophica bacterium]|nr:prepilin-type N-terminal cleavage/methylation domain-containing protein [Candidatus Omnitrophota bacterium]